MTARRIVVPHDLRRVDPTLGRTTIEYGNAVNNVVDAVGRSLESSGDLRTTIGGHKHTVGPVARSDLAAGATSNLFWFNVSGFAEFFPVWASGSIIAFSAVLSGEPTDGSLTLELMRGNFETTTQTIREVPFFLAKGSRLGVVTFAKDELPFEVNDFLKARVVTSSSWAPTTLDMLGFFGVEM